MEDNLEIKEDNMDEKKNQVVKARKRCAGGFRGSVKDVEKIWFSMEDVMVYLSVGRHSVENMVNRGVIRAFRPGKQYLFDKREIDNWVQKNCVNEVAVRMQANI